MFGASYQIARIWGIPIKVHVSLILLLAYFGLYGGLVTGREFGWAAGSVALVFGVLLMTLLFASVALHELGHSYVAIRKGCRVRQITLMFLGGAAQMDRMPTRPRDEILMAVAGPTVSIVLGTSLLAFASYLAARGWTLPHLVVRNVGFLNLLLAGFNLLPAFPMDGGRILRASLTPRMGRLPATRVAAKIGKVLAVALGIFALMNGMWILVAIAFYIYTVGGAEYRMMQVQESFKSDWQGFSEPLSWGRGASLPDPDPDPDDDEVIVSPPSYRKGPAQRVDIQRENRAGRNRFFS